MSDDVERLVADARSGERAAASELIALHYERIFAWFRRFCGSDADAADLTQKAFCKAWDSLAAYQGRSSFNTWLHGIAHHVYVDWRRVHHRVDAQSDEWWESCVAEGPSPFDSAAEREAAHQVYRAVEQTRRRCTGDRPPPLLPGAFHPGDGGCPGHCHQHRQVPPAPRHRQPADAPR